MLSSAFCLKCKQLYDLDQRKVCTGTCTHSICEQCFDRKLSGSCPICEKEHAFDEKVINWSAHEMIKQLVENISLSTLLDTKFDEKTVGIGPCSQCKELRKLRVCVDCAIHHGLLEKSKNGDVELSTGTSKEFLETKVLRIRSLSLCADCAFDEKKHKGDGHNLIPVADIKNIKDTSEMLNTLSNASIAIRRIEQELKGVKELKPLMLGFTFISEGFKLAEQIKVKLEKESKEDTSQDQDTQRTIQFFNTVLDLSTHGTNFFYKQMSGEVLQIAVKKMEQTESVKEKNELKKTIEKLKGFETFFQSRPSDFNISLKDVVNVFKTVGMLFEDDTTDNKADDNSTISEVVRDIYNITNDARHMIKLPHKYDELINIAGSCLQLFIGEKKKTIEDTDLD